MSVVVLLYSKYSSACESLLQKMSVMDYRKICVDHEKVRKLVVSDQKKYSIQKVPCILVFFSNGLVKKYEGEDAFAWVHETIEKMRVLTTPPPSFPTPSPTPVMVPTVAPVEVVVPPQKPFRHFQNDVDDDEDNDAVERAFQPLSTLHPRESIAVQPVDLDSEGGGESGVPDMRRAMDSAPLPIQKLKMVSSSPSSSSENDSDSNGGATPMRGIKSDKQENLMSLAQQMQKQREKEDETIQKVSA